MNLSSPRPVFLFICGVILIHTLFLLNVDLLPFIDLPNHLAEATIFKYHNDSPNPLAPYYRPVPWYFPNTFHVVFCSLFPSVELGNKVFFILYIALLLFSTLLVIKHLKGNLWFGVLAVVLIYNMNVGWGFTGFAIAIPTTVLLFYVLLKEVQTGHPAYLLGAGCLLVLLFLMHAQVALFGLLLTGLVMLFRYHRSIKDILLKAVIIPLPLVILLFFWWNNRGHDPEESTISYMLNYYRSEFFTEFPKRGKLLFLDNWHLREGAAGIVIGCVFSMLIIVPVLAALFRKGRASSIELVKTNPYPTIFLLCAALCFLLLPNRLPGQWPIYERFSPLVILTFIIFGSIVIKDLQFRALRAYAMVIALVYSVFWFEYIYTFNQKNKVFNAAFYKEARFPFKSAGLIYDLNYRGRPVYMHFPNYFLVWKKGLTATKMIDFRFGVVRRGTLGSRIPEYSEWVGINKWFNPVYNETIDYLLVRGQPPATETNLRRYQLVNKQGPWMLYKNKKRGISVAENNRVKVPVQPQ